MRPLLLLVSLMVSICSPLPDGESGTARSCTTSMRLAAVSARTVEVGEFRSGVFTPYVDGGSATLVRGFQGFDMVLPALRFPAVDGDPTDLCETVVLTQTGATAAEILMTLNFSRVGNYFVSGTIDDPIVAGTLTISARMTGPNIQSTTAPVTVRVGAGDAGL